MYSSVCLIAKNEERAIAEWIAYQIEIGFDLVYVYDNDSDDTTPQIINQIAAMEPAVIYRHWPNAPDRRPQVSAYNDALVRAGTEWIAFFDTDEFIVLKNHETINDLLRSIPEDAGCVAVNWLLFGSSGLLEYEPKLVIERFTKCAMPKYGKNHFVKSIVRPSFVSRMVVHHAELKKGRCVNPSGQTTEVVPPKSVQIDFETAHLNHYCLKNREEFNQKRAMISPHEVVRVAC